MIYGFFDTFEVHSGQTAWTNGGTATGIIQVVGKGGYGRTQTRTQTFSKAFLHLYNSFFSYLTLLQQHSLPDPGVDLVIALIHI